MFGLQNHLSKYFSELLSLPCQWSRSIPALRVTSGHELLLLPPRTYQGKILLILVKSSFSAKYEQARDGIVNSEPSLHWLLWGNMEERESSISLQPWEWRKETPSPSSPWLRCVNLFAQGQIIACWLFPRCWIMAQGWSFSLCHPLPQPRGIPGTGRQLFMWIFQYYCKRQTLQRFKKRKTKEAPQNDEENNVDKSFVYQTAL